MKNAEVSEMTLFLVPRNATSCVNTVGFPHKPDLLKTGTVVKDWGQTDTVSGVSRGAAVGGAAAAGSANAAAWSAVWPPPLPPPPHGSPTMDADRPLERERACLPVWRGGQRGGHGHPMSFLLSHGQRRCASPCSDEKTCVPFVRPCAVDTERSRRCGRKRRVPLSLAC